MIDLAEPEQDEPEQDETAPVAASTTDNPLRYSVLKLMKLCAAKARDAALRDGEQSLALRLGAAGHALTFGTPEVVVFRGKQRRGKEWDVFAAEHAGKVIVNAKEYERAKGMADAIRNHPVAARVLLAPDAIREERIDWTWSGRAWRSTPDARGFRWAAELKTTRCADPAVFHRDALRLSYHVQAAIYCDAIEQATGVRPTRFYLFAVESAPPYVVTPFEFSNRSLDHGARLAREWHAKFLECEARNEWPGYSARVEELDVYDPDDEATLEVERAMANDDGVRATANF